MSKEQEGGVGVGDGKRKTKLSKKARMKLKKAAGVGVGAVVMKRKGDGALALNGKPRIGGADGGMGEAGSKKRNRKKRKKGIPGGEAVEEGSDEPEVKVVAAPAPKRPDGAKRLSYFDKVGLA